MADVAGASDYDSRALCAAYDNEQCLNASTSCLPPLALSGTSQGRESSTAAAGRAVTWWLQGGAAPQQAQYPVLPHLAPRSPSRTSPKSTPMSRRP
jgi:hypothetical protein